VKQERIGCGDSKSSKCAGKNIPEQKVISTPVNKKEIAGIKPQQAKQCSIFCMIFVLVRLAIIEFPLVILFALAMSGHILSHVYEEHLDPQFDLQ